MEQKAAHTPGTWQIEWNVAQGGEGHYITDSKDMAVHVNKAERATQANADRALDLQIKFQNLPGAWA